MEAPPLISPDGAYWWDGRAWQPMPPAPTPPPVTVSHDFPPPPPGVAPPVPDPNRPSWLADVPAGLGRPDDVVVYAPVAETPAWEAPAPPPSPIRALLLWGGLVLGAAVLLLGLLGIVAVQTAPSAENAGTMPFAIAFVIAGAVLGGVFLLKVLGFTINMGPAGLAFGQLGIVGSLVMGAMLLNTYIAVTEPIGGGRYTIPLGTIAIMVRRALMGRWLAVFILGGVWVACVAVIQLHGGP